MKRPHGDSFEEMPTQGSDSLDKRSLSLRAGARWRAWLARRRTLRNQQLLDTGSGARMMSASLTTLDRDVAALGWPDGGDFFPVRDPETSDAPPPPRG